MPDPAQDPRLIALRDRAVEHPDFKSVVAACTEMMNAFDEFFKTVGGVIPSLGLTGGTIEEINVEAKAREMQMWLEQMSLAAQRRRLFELIGKLGSEEKSNVTEGPWPQPAK